MRQFCLLLPSRGLAAAPANAGKGFKSHQWVQICHLVLMQRSLALAGRGKLPDLQVEILWQQSRVGIPLAPCIPVGWSAGLSSPNCLRGQQTQPGCQVQTLKSQSFAMLQSTTGLGKKQRTFSGVSWALRVLFHFQVQSRRSKPILNNP